MELSIRVSCIFCLMRIGTNTTEGVVSALRTFEVEQRQSRSQPNIQAADPSLATTNTMPASNSIPESSGSQRPSHQTTLHIVEVFF